MVQKFSFVYMPKFYLFTKNSIAIVIILTLYRKIQLLLLLLNMCNKTLNMLIEAFYELEHGTICREWAPASTQMVPRKQANLILQRATLQLPAF